MKKVLAFVFSLSLLVVAMTNCSKPEEPEQPTGIVPEKVDLGLPSGLKWANFNVGATREMDYGLFYQWGGVTAVTREGWDIYPWGSENALTKYCTDAAFGTVDNKTTLELADDAAHVAYGGEWRMPTMNEAYELWSNCTRTWDSIGYVYGYRFTGPNGNSIFLPSNGWINEEGEIFGYSEQGNYWTSSLHDRDNNNAYGLLTRTGDQTNEGVLTSHRGNRRFARGVRAVCP